MSALKEQMAETVLGAIVAAVAAGFLFFAATHSGRTEVSGGYALNARFARADGVASGTDVRMSGVKIGSVSSITLDPETYFAKVAMNVTSAVKIPDDSTARIATDGLLGGAYIALEPGGSPDMLAANGEVVNTQGSVDLLTLLASAVGGAAGGGAQQSNATPEPATP